MFVTEFCRIRKHWPLQAAGNLIRPAQKLHRITESVNEVRSSEWTDNNIKDLRNRPSGDSFQWNQVGIATRRRRRG
ncbi:hypothetical protein CEXT_766411 [Caerostris extrusa]|uniref:Uncharacterized protein n=1 Tax=Caerostris extrusa TaxID=172846 RepID=A0AAV4UDV0_CAEEX|nr:hypothetical protein CEXT_766411 [Caerostris extrusa]